MSSRKEDVAKKKALSKMGGDKEEFLKFLKLQRQGVYMVSVSCSCTSMTGMCTVGEVYCL